MTDEQMEIVCAADVAPAALGKLIGESVAVVLLDHSHAEHADPNVHDLANAVLLMAGMAGIEADPKALETWLSEVTP